MGKVALLSSSDFIAKNQLAREGSQIVSQVTIPALTTIVVVLVLFIDIEIFINSHYICRYQ